MLNNLGTTINCGCNVFFLNFMNRLLLKSLLLLTPLVLKSSGILNVTDKNLAYNNNIPSPIEHVNDPWVDSVFNSLTTEQRIAQLIMTAVYSNRDDAYQKQIIELVEKYRIGGVIFMQGGPVRQALLNNKLQQVSKVPLMVAIDGEWGLAMRLDSVPDFPKQMQLGAVTDNKQIYNMGVEIARQCKLLGIHVNFAPVIDVNSNAKNPVINNRSFGQDNKNVALKGLAYMQGMQDNGVLAVGKHFPGHGDTGVDSHYDLPVVDRSVSELKNTELMPFKVLINNGLGGIMVAHLSLPKIEPAHNRPSTLSKIIVDSLLIKSLNFNGLIFTDALNMKGVTKHYKPGQIEVEALLAGNDILLFPEDTETAINAIINAVKNGIISSELIDNKCKKVLKTKKWLNLNTYKPVNIDSVKNNLWTVNSSAIANNLVKSSVTVIQNKPVVPIKNIDNKKIVSIAFTNNETNVFQQTLKLYTGVQTFVVGPQNINNNVDENIAQITANADYVIVSQHCSSQFAKNNFGISNAAIELIDKIANSKTIFVLLGNAYALNFYNNTYLCGSTVVAYNNDSVSQSYAAQAIFGGIAVSGKLPVNAGKNYLHGTGTTIDKPIRLGYESPCYFGVDTQNLLAVDSIVNWAINTGAMPGCQVLYAKNGKVVYNKVFGHVTQNKKQPVTLNHVYDIASVTKVVATTAATIKLYDQHKINPASKISKYMPQLKDTDKKKVRVNEIMAHNAGLRTWIPFYRNTLDSLGKPRPDIYSATADSLHTVAVSRKLYLTGAYRDSIFKAIIDTPLYEQKKYRYSDVGFYWLGHIISSIAGKPFGNFVDSCFYKPLGMNSTAFNAYKNIDKQLIVPSEVDQYYRFDTIAGYVHDPGAAMLGGIAGHAGLFSNSTDLAKICQMFLNQGVYGGVQYFKSRSFNVFNKAYFKKYDNRRALGFDKPAFEINQPGPACASASQQSFGHSGFTGCYIWADPANQSIFIFVSNRTFPNQENKKLADNNVRTNIHQQFYNIFSQ